MCVDDDVARKRAGNFRRCRIDCFFTVSCLYGPFRSSCFALAGAVEGHNDDCAKRIKQKGSAKQPWFYGGIKRHAIFTKIGVAAVTS